MPPGIASARIASNRTQPFDRAKSLPQTLGTPALVLDLFGQPRELREQNCALPFGHPVVRAHQRTLERVSRAAPSAIDQRLASLFQVGIVDENHSAFAGGHRLAALTAEASGCAVRSYAAT